VSVAVAAIVAVELGNLNVPPTYLMAGMVGFIIPDLMLKSTVKKRHKRILRLLPEIIDLLALCVGAGLDFVLALNRIINVKQYVREPLVQELNLALQEMKLGKRRGEALKNMARRVELQELSSFVRTIVQADRMGTPIAQVLAAHAEDVRNQRFVRAEREALKAPLKILGPLIFCIMPCVGIIVAAPVFLQFVKQNPFQ
jgi:tight adherence protein C